MADIVVTVAKNAWLTWLAEGDLPGEDETSEWGLHYGGRPPRDVRPGDRVYVVAFDMVRGYAPLHTLAEYDNGFALVRGGGAVACSLFEDGAPRRVPGFRGVRYASWGRDEVQPFPDWQTAGLPPKQAADVTRLRRLREDAAHRETLRERALMRVLDASWGGILRGMP